MEISLLAAVLVAVALLLLGYRRAVKRGGKCDSNWLFAYRDEQATTSNRKE